MRALGLHGEELIEGGRSVNLAEGYAERRGDERQRGLIEVFKLLLNRMQRLNQGVSLISQLTHGGSDGFPSLVVGWGFALLEIWQHALRRSAGPMPRISRVGAMPQAGKDGSFA